MNGFQGIQKQYLEQYRARRKQQLADISDPKLKALCGEFIDQPETSFATPKVTGLRSWKPIKEAKSEEQVVILLAAVKHLADSKNSQHSFSDCLEEVISQLIKKQLPVSEEQACFILESFLRASLVAPWKKVLGFLERYTAKNGVSERLSGLIDQCAESIAEDASEWYNASERQLSERMRLLVPRSASNVLSVAGARKAPLRITADEAWSDRCLADYEAMKAEEQASWNKLFIHAAALTSTKPSVKWLNSAAAMVERIGTAEFEDKLVTWFSLLPKRGTVLSEDSWEDNSEIYSATNADILKGLVWAASTQPSTNILRALGDAAEVCLKKVYNHGPRCPKVANACTSVLAQIGTPDAIAQLSRLKGKAKHASSKAQLDKAMQSAAQSAGMTVQDLEELNVPKFGMSQIGQLERIFGTYICHLKIENNDVITQWSDTDGKSYKSVPARVKSEHNAELKELKKDLDQLDKLLPGVRYRIESAYIAQRHWNYQAWRERYLEHPLVGQITRRLIWSFNGKAGAFLNGQIVDHEDKPLDVDIDHTLVELWHPIAADQAVIQAWREWLRRHQITQPFKQAHREIYVLTDAELTTATYSNRFAAHILRQHQFAQLCQHRGWQYTLQGTWDSANTPILKLPNWQMQAVFWINASGNEEQSGSGVFMTVATDQVRFTRDGGEAIPLTQILPIVFSEVMRDVDLFVGVASVGNDPDWADRGGGHRTYWQDFSFGALGVSAEMRKQTLQEVIPYLHIAERCSFTERFLVVRGDHRTYKIHLGSGNILMEPNDQYLCIVADRKPGKQHVYLPFAGDETLAIILSKAFFLAEDSKITDQSILSQIRRR